MKKFATVIRLSLTFQSVFNKIHLPPCENNFVHEFVLRPSVHVGFYQSLKRAWGLSIFAGNKQLVTVMGEQGDDHTSPLHLVWEMTSQY